VSFYAVKYNLSCRCMECASKLNRVIQCDSEMSKCTLCRNKSEAVVNNVLAPHLVAVAKRLKWNMLLRCFYRWQQPWFTKIVSCCDTLQGMKSQSIDLSSTPNEKSHIIANCQTVFHKHWNTMAYLQSVLLSLVITWTLILDDTIALEIRTSFMPWNMN
jgi:hypothetical protein